ncbi:MULTISPECIES: chorismate-binding protein [unclassified Pseudomonas]|uniref:chorismate-binding protein n=1 Tax=unclassified Pseudomonas TaxID=196821 RepID=UPI002448FF9D|nr:MULTISPECIES: chorismate-binding protein [unclassified Pseudomonas]MDH0304198.1 chorismate-binding protein [Pseudomonas sp. GD04091]MDH1986199.1 chorismate-binding protein [Pseudomonas sp. GD03689]
MISPFDFSLPAPALGVQDTGSALLAELSSAFPALAEQFSCVFSEHTDGRDRSLVGLGSQYRLCVTREPQALRIDWLDHDRVLYRDILHLDRERCFHEQLFKGVAHFWKTLRDTSPALAGLPGDVPLLGGWRCATHPERLDEPLIMTLPSLFLWVEHGRISGATFAADLQPRIEQAVARLAPRSYPALPAVSSCELIPQCTDYVDNLLDLLKEMSTSEADKVVIGREVRLKMSEAVDPLQLLEQVAPRPNPHYEYLFCWDQGPAWIGISPETLIRTHGSNVVVEPLAGTRKGSSEALKRDRYRQELLSDKKELEEHETAAQLFLEQLQQVCRPGSLDLRESRNVIDLGYVQHLKSRIEGELATGANVFDALAAVYPPATIWGKPLDLSGERIRRFEYIDREFFTGGLGYLTLAGQSNFALAIRTAKVTAAHVHIFAGSGIVKASDPYREWLETSNKMKPYLQNGSWSYRG